MRNPMQSYTAGPQEKAHLPAANSGNYYHAATMLAVKHFTRRRPSRYLETSISVTTNAPPTFSARNLTLSPALTAVSMAGSFT